MSNRKRRRSQQIRDLKQRASAGDELATEELVKLLSKKQNSILNTIEQKKEGKKKLKNHSDDAFFKRMTGHYGG